MATETKQIKLPEPPKTNDKPLTSWAKVLYVLTNGSTSVQATKRPPDKK